MTEQEETYYKDHEEEMKIYLDWEAKQKDKGDSEYEDEEEDEEKDEEKEPPKKPVFEPKEHEDSFDGDHPVIEIPNEVPEEFDNDWVLSEEEVSLMVEQYWEVKV